MSIFYRGHVGNGEIHSPSRRHVTLLLQDFRQVTQPLFCPSVFLLSGSVEITRSPVSSTILCFQTCFSVVEFCLEGTFTCKTRRKWGARIRAPPCALSAGLWPFSTLCPPACLAGQAESHSDCFCLLQGAISSRTLMSSCATC